MSSAETESNVFFYFLNLDYNRKKDIFLDKKIKFFVRDKNLPTSALLLYPNQDDEKLIGKTIPNGVVFQFKLEVFATLAMEK